MFQSKNNNRSKIAIAIGALGLCAIIYFIIPSLWTSSASDLTRPIITNKIQVPRPTLRSGIAIRQLPKEKSALPVFLKDGWSKIDVPPPNEKLLELAPELLRDHPQELYEQLSSGAIGPRHIDNMATIFTQTQDEKIRYRIIENLGTLNLAKAEQVMMSIYPTSTPNEKAMLIGFLHPLDHLESHNFLIQLCNGANGNEQSLGLTALASVSIFSGNTNFNQITLSRLSQASRIKYANIQEGLKSLTWTEHTH
ncbi:MAG: hypothetical protein AABY86_11990 [Bdellovibrionota bacterium]